MLEKLLFGLTILGLGFVCGGSASAQTFVNIPALSFTQAYGGGNPLPQTLAVNSTGSAFNYNVASSTASGGNWLQVSPSGGNCCTTSSTITVSIAPASPLAAGTYTGQIVLTKTNDSSATLTIPVTLTVNASNTAFFDSLPGQVSFSFLTSGNAPPSQFIQIRNAGSGALNWTLSTSTADGGGWLKASSTSGSAPSIISVGITTSALPGGGQIAGVYIGQIVLQSGGKSVSIPVSVTVGTTVFEQVNALNFTKPYAGKDPLPQTLTVVSTGSNFNVNISSYTGPGGNWLSVSPAGGNCCTTPESVTVSVNPAVNLAAGTYTGEVVVTQTAGHGMAMTIPVTLTIATSSSQSLFDNMPGQLSYSLQTNGSAPPSQLVQIRNAGAGTLNWTLSSSTADGSQWLTSSAVSGTATSMISVGINPANLPNGGHVAGTFIGQLVFQTPGDVTTIPVSVTVGDNVFEQVNGIDFTKPYAGADPLPQTLTIASTGSAFNINVAAYTATGGSWLSVSPSGGNCCTTPESLTMSVHADPSLSAGTYTGQIVVTQTSGNSMAMTIPVTLSVGSNTPFFDNLPGQMSFLMKTGGNAPPNQPMQIRNGGTGTLNWSVSASTADGGSWLAISPTSGVAPSNVSVSINRAALPGGGQIAGTFTGQLVFQTTGDAVTVPVSVVVGDSVFEQVNPINFTKPYAGANPLPQTLTIASTGTNFNINVQASTATGGNWLNVSPSGGNCCTTPEAITLSVNPAANLAAGTYTGQVVIAQTAGNGMSMTVPVTLTIAAANAAFFDNLPGQVSFSMQTGGKTPPLQPLQIRNGGTGTLNWSVSKSTADGGAWLSVSPVSGTAPSSVFIGVNPALLPGGGQVGGIFTGQLVFQTAGDVVTVPVSVTLGDSVFEQVSPLNFTKPYAGANPLPQTLMIATPGTNFNINVQASTATGGNWLAVSPNGGNCCTTPESLTVSVNPDSHLAAGTYTGQVVIAQTADNGMSMTVPVTLTVAATNTAFFDNVQGQLSYSFVSKGANPPSHSIQIRNGGTGTLNWNLSTSTADGGSWLAVSLASGTAPSAVTVSVNAAALPSGGQVAGIFTGQVLLQTSGDAVTIPVSVVVDTSVFQQLDSLTFSKIPGGTNPAAQTNSIASTGSNFNINVYANSGNGGKWLQVTPFGGNCCTTPRALTVSVNPDASLPAGLYTGQIVVTQTSGNGMSMTIPVYLAIGTQTLKPTTTSVTTSVNPSTYGQAVTFTATISASGSGLSGTVTFNDGASALGTAAVSGTTATFTTTALTTGAHSITAVYGGNSSFSGSGSPALTQTVGAGGAATNETVTSSLNPSIVNGAITISVKVSSSAGTPTGSVTFKDGSTALTTATLASGVAFYSTSSLAAGAHSITVAYSGGGGFAASTSSALVQVVLRPTTTALTTSVNPATFGQFITLTATVTGAAAGQNGYVTFLDGSVPLSSVPLNGAIAALSLSNLAKGTHTISAIFSGSAIYAGSIALARSQVVQ